LICSVIIARQHNIVRVGLNYQFHSSGSFAIFAAIRCAHQGWKQSIGIATLSEGRIGGSHEAFAIRLGSFRGCRLH
jgi:hypothetical protein